MINTLNELETFFHEHESAVYSRDTYDQFVANHDIKLLPKSIHITGTNGKGSTANFIYNMYRAASYKVGLYQSPYFGSVLKMISINGRNITEQEYLEIFNRYERHFIKYGLTSFEMQTIIAYTFFNENNLDLVVIEVGMGGFIDATNIIKPILSIITSVSLEHTSYLGKSVSEIAHNKGGIIKEDVPCLVGKLEESALYAIRELCSYSDSKLYVVDDFHHLKREENSLTFDYLPYHNLRINNLSHYLVKDASIAIEAAKILSEAYPIGEEAIKQGLLDNLLPYRFDFYNSQILIDGAHNKEAIENLCETLEREINKPIHTIFASFRDKNIDAILPLLQKDSVDLTITTFDHKRARTEEEYFLYLGDYSFEENYKELLLKLISEFPDDIILVTGSLYFAALVKDFLINEHI